jgi:hypothetical protein
MGSAVVPTDVDQAVNHADVSLSSLTAHDGSLYQLDQSVLLDDMLDQGDLSMPLNGWGEAQVIPGLANFMGMTGEWLANGVEEEPELDSFLK